MRFITCDRMSKSSESSHNTLLDCELTSQHHPHPRDDTHLRRHLLLQPSFLHGRRLPRAHTQLLRSLRHRKLLHTLVPLHRTEPTRTKGVFPQRAAKALDLAAEAGEDAAEWTDLVQHHLRGRLSVLLYSATLHHYRRYRADAESLLSVLHKTRERPPMDRAPTGCIRLDHHILPSPILRAAEGRSRAAEAFPEGAQHQAPHVPLLLADVVARAAFHQKWSPEAHSAYRGIRHTRRNPLYPDLLRDDGVRVHLPLGFSMEAL